MGRLGTRLLLVATGVAALVGYAALAFLLYRGLLLLWAQRPDPVTTVAVVAGATVAFGYASYRFGTARLRVALDPVELPPREAPRLHGRVADLADRIGVDRPRLLVARLDQPNALALGGARNGAVVLDASLFRLLTAAELEAIVAHELAHLKWRDSLLKAVGYAFVRTATGLVWVAVLPLAVVVGGAARAVALVRGESVLDVSRTARRADAAVTAVVGLVLFALTALVRAYGRRREYAADARAARATGRPLALARALEKIRRAAAPGGPLSPWLIHGDEEGTVTRLLATHPPMDERIERLRRLA